MSDVDENESEEEEEEEGSNDSDGSGSEENDDDTDVDEEQQKADATKQDIALIKDIFSYIDQTSKRIVNKFETERELNKKANSDQRRQNLEDLETPDVSWSHYENLDDAQRAQLLEKAIMVLGQDNNSGRR